MKDNLLNSLAAHPAVCSTALLGRVFDARHKTPPDLSDVLVFVDVQFDWMKGAYIDGGYIVPWVNKHKPVKKELILYWTVVPPFSIAELRGLAKPKCPRRRRA